MTQKWAVIPWQQYTSSFQEEEGTQIGKGEPSLSIDTILLGIPKLGRRDATAILHHIQNSSDISWNSRGELTVHGTVVANSHIADLLKFSLFQYKSWKPAALTEFYRALADSNLPVGLIRNRESRSLLEKFKKPQPPGIRATKWLTWE